MAERKNLIKIDGVDPFFRPNRAIDLTHLVPDSNNPEGDKKLSRTRLLMPVGTVALTRRTPTTSSPPPTPPVPGPNSNPQDSIDPRKSFCLGLIIVILAILFITIMHPILYHLNFDPVKLKEDTQKGMREELQKFHEQKYSDELYVECFKRNFRLENEKLQTAMVPLLEMPPIEGIKSWISFHVVSDPGTGPEEFSGFGDSMLTMANELAAHRQKRFDALKDAKEIVKVRTHDITDEGIHFESLVHGYNNYIEQQKQLRVLRRSCWQIIKAANECYSSYEMEKIRAITNAWEDVHEAAKTTWLSRFYSNHIVRVFEKIASIPWPNIIIAAVFIFCCCMAVYTACLDKGKR